jgi:signal transduction histidine kinase
VVARQSERELTKNIVENVKFIADESKIRQLTTILLDNAFKYCDEKGRVEVSLAAEKKGVCLTVSNHYREGKDVDYSRFFERFYRQDAAHSIDRGGYGIGLSIAEAICRGYKGSIHAEWHDGIISFVCHLR